jgi:ABC-type branched-subunit amino acid transport system substrate-binding protein
MIAVLAATLSDASHAAGEATETIAVHASMTGAGGIYGAAFADGARLAVDEANLAGGMGQLTLQVFEDHSTTDGASAAAQQIVDSDALGGGWANAYHRLAGRWPDLRPGRDRGDRRDRARR